jgi:hypothetical protein
VTTVLVLSGVRRVRRHEGPILHSWISRRLSCSKWYSNKWYSKERIARRYTDAEGALALGVRPGAAVLYIP